MTPLAYAKDYILNYYRLQDAVVIVDKNLQSNPFDNNKLF
jgi:hypothetical protein